MSTRAPMSAGRTPSASTAPGGEGVRAIRGGVASSDGSGRRLFWDNAVSCIRKNLGDRQSCGSRMAGAGRDGSQRRHEIAPEVSGAALRVGSAAGVAGSMPVPTGPVTLLYQ